MQVIEEMTSDGQRCGLGCGGEQGWESERRKGGEERNNEGEMWNIQYRVHKIIENR